MKRRKIESKSNHSSYMAKPRFTRQTAHRAKRYLRDRHLELRSCFHSNLHLSGRLLVEIHVSAVNDSRINNGP